jgi:ribokinase
VRLLVCGGIFREEIAGRPPRLGGSGLTAALAAASYGAEVSLAGWVGTREADELFVLLEQAGIEYLGVEVLNGPTTTYRIADPADLSDPQPAMSLGSVPSAELPALPTSPMLLCFGTPGFDAVRARWLDRASEGSTLIFDRQGSHSMISGAAMAATIPAVRRILLANAYEAMSQTRQSDLASSIAHLPPANFQGALVKGGPWGVLVRDSDGVERPVGAYNVPVLSTIGSGDVFAGTFAAQLAQGAEAHTAALTASAAAAVWISSGEDHPDSQMPSRVQAMMSTPAVWVDRRRLEATQFVLRADQGLENAARERIGRALRYLGIETFHTSGKTSQHLDVRVVVSEGDDPVGAAVSRAIARIREGFGSQTG